MLERRHQQLAPRRVFFKRLGRSVAFALAMLVISLAIGVVGYHLIAHLSWVDSLLNATMILTAMGPVDKLESTGAKIFASIYAIFSGVVFITCFGVIASPIAHRMIHRFHLESDESARSRSAR